MTSLDNKYKMWRLNMDLGIKYGFKTSYNDVMGRQIFYLFAPTIFLTELFYVRCSPPNSTNLKQRDDICDSELR